MLPLLFLFQIIYTACVTQFDSHCMLATQRANKSFQIDEV